MYLSLSLSLSPTGGNSDELRFSYNTNAKVLTIGRPGVVISTDFTVTINN